MIEIIPIDLAFSEKPYKFSDCSQVFWLGKWLGGIAPHTHRYLRAELNRGVIFSARIVLFAVTCFPDQLIGSLVNIEHIKRTWRYICSYNVIYHSYYYYYFSVKT